MPYLVFCCARRRENITIMWSTVVVTAYFALLLYSVDKMWFNFHVLLELDFDL